MISVTNLTTQSTEESFFQKLAKIVLTEEKKEGGLSIVLVGSGKMRKLNKQYRGKNRTTDVLSFEGTKLSEFKIPRGIETELGEIVICLREVKKNAKKFNSVFETELARVLIHGILHLLGYDHQKMEEKQNHYLKTWPDLIS